MSWTRTFLLAILFLATIPIVSGCGSENADNKKKEETPPDSSESSTQSPKTEKTTPSQLSAAHILIAYKGSERAAATVTRSKAEALDLAKEIAEKAKAKDADFPALAQEHSDGPSGPGGGSLGVFPLGGMVPPFEQALLALDVGEVSGIVETQFGYHIILRNPVILASAKHILVQYQGSMRAPGSITRTKEEALTRVKECLERANKGEDFAALAEEYSDGPSKSRGGDLGEFPKGAMHPKFDEAVFTGEVGKVSEIVETPFGYHIIYRYK